MHALLPLLWTRFMQTLPARFGPGRQRWARGLFLGAALLGASCNRKQPALPPEATAAAWARVPTTAFQMGCDPERDPQCSETERPRHAVRVAAFLIHRTEVTQAEYQSCVEAGKCSRPAGAFNPTVRPHRPVTHVTWAQARSFCAASGNRLPTEAEWELAARGSDGRVYPWGDGEPTCQTAHTQGCGDGPADVGGRLAGASPFGVLDMAGNVDEWVEDIYRPYGGPANGRVPALERVARGGAYDAWHSRSSARNALQPQYHDALLGFRCARSGADGRSGVGAPRGR